ncbi:hypothetical protein J3D47_005350 [Pseudomonas laurylsulfativorans]|uniref:hypothetical protein n=1 Tax=Pseudomonas laurylsulfativorans TaxID=1943631 RepID=UPI0020A17CC1|nr:hypothetical protein [Pseudomonas laurylsulfativorans]MCP1421107.1 hypothetical protein [Pseudomonas laurylsulfativorans]
MAVLLAAPFSIVATLSVVAIGTGIYSIYNSEVLGAIATNAKNFFSDKGLESYLDYVCAPDMQIVHKNTLRDVYSNQMLSCNWISETGELQPSAVPVFDENIGGGGGYIPISPALPAPLPDIIPVVTIGPLEINDGSDDNGDEYGCCTGGSDGYV